MTEPVRPAAVAGAFYPGDARTLDALVRRLLASAPPPSRADRPKAIIAPHAGYVYSGACAARAFALLAGGPPIRRVVLVGPAHRVRVAGLAWPDAERMRTPLGEVTIDQTALDRVPNVQPSQRAHADEHCLEVELPFLQIVAPDAEVVPMVVGGAGPDEVAGVLDSLWGGEETVLVVSSDLSHYLPYDVGRELDQETAARILARADDLDGDRACGAAAINGLMRVAARRGLTVELVDLRSSGDAEGVPQRAEVVGYGAFALYEPAR